MSMQVTVKDLADTLEKMGLPRYADVIRLHGSDGGRDSVPKASPWSSLHSALLHCIDWGVKKPGELTWNELHAWLASLSSVNAICDAGILNRIDKERREHGGWTAANDVRTKRYTVDDLYSWLEAHGREKHCAELERVLLEGGLSSDILPGSGASCLSNVLNRCILVLDDVSLETWSDIRALIQMDELLSVSDSVSNPGVSLFLDGDSLKSMT